MDVITKGILPLLAVGALVMIGLPVCESIDLFCDTNGTLNYFWLFCFVGLPFGLFRTGIHFVGRGLTGFALSLVLNFAVKGILGGIFMLFYVARACVVLFVAVGRVVFCVIPELLLLLYWLGRWGISGILTFARFAKSKIDKSSI